MLIYKSLNVRWLGGKGEPGIGVWLWTRIGIIPNHSRRRSFALFVTLPLLKVRTKQSDDAR